MKFTYPEISEVFDTNIEYVNTIVIENQDLMYRLLEDIRKQIDKNDGKSILSENDNLISLSQHIELLTDFVQFDINKKILTSKLVSKLIEAAIDEERYESTNSLVNSIEKYLYELSFSCTGNICFEKCNFDSLIKATSPKFDSSTDTIGERVIDYIELVNEYDRCKLFITYNLRDVISDFEVFRFMETIKKKNYKVIMLEAKSHPLIEFEKRFIVDDTLCEIK